MTTQHTHYEQSDVDTTVVEHSFTPESAVSSTATEGVSPDEGETSILLPSSVEPTDPQDAKQDEAPAAQGEHMTGANMTEGNTTKIDLTETSSVEPVSTGASTVQIGMVEPDPTEGDMAQMGMAEARPAETSMAGINVTGTNRAETDVAGVDMTEANPDTTMPVPPQHENTEAAEEVTVHRESIVDLPSPESTLPSGEEHVAFSFMEEMPLEAGPGELRSFTDYIEEFRQTEARYTASLQESQGAFSLLTPLPGDVDTLYQAPLQSDTPGMPSAGIGEVLPTEPSGVEKIGMASAPAIPVEEQVIGASTPVQAVDEAAGAETSTLSSSAEPVAPPSPRPPVERPVSPLLRPATRLRLPRHGNVRQREEEQESAVGTPPTPQVAPEVPPVPQAVPTETGTEQAKPTRRYRFDRPSAASTPASSTQPQRTEENREKDLLNRSGFPTPARPDNGQSSSGLVTETQPKQTTAGNSSSLEQPSAKLQEPVSAELSEAERRHRYGQDRQQDQPPSAPTMPPASQAIPASPAPSATVSGTPQPEVATSTLVPTTPQAEEIAPEDLPPLEYSELQKASSRRRRRHRAGSNNSSSVASSAGAPTPSAAAKPAPPEASAPAAPQGMTPTGGTPPSAVPTMPTTPTRVPNNIAAMPQQYNIVSGYTLNQMNQGNEHTGPFMAPEPSPARGSVSTRDGRTARAEAQRTHVYPVRSPDTAPSATSIQQLGSLLSQAIQTQTDRMVAELRRANQSPANISVSLPPFPSTERVGVFVDVANLLYSARTQRISIDFGKLLDFLRGNRRLVRAHAYCPTSPQPGEDQMFLQAVKGLGYRITTKHYKTFASGARKADLDLDLCMDVVRLVEGRAVDCIVLVSGDSDFMPMLDFCSDHGVRVEVAAFDEAMSATLRQSCDLFINLSMLEEIRS